MTTMETQLTPARRTIRTVLQVLIALAALTPFVLDAVGVRDVVIGGVSVLAVAAAIARVMALPAVETFLRRFLPWLAAGNDHEPSGGAAG